MKKKKKVKKRKNALLPILIILIVIILLTITIKHKENKINDNINPEIFYIFSDDNKIPIEENNKLFVNPIIIVWTDDCLGTIKRNGEKISDQNNTKIFKDGNYEIVVHSPFGKNKITRKFLLDTTAPSIEIEEKDENKYIITFENINDVKEATISKINNKTNEVIETKNILPDITNNKYEITIDGYYVLKVSDEHNNTVTKELKINKRRTKNE